MSVRGAELAADAGMEEALRAGRVQAWKVRAERWLDEQPLGRLFTADTLVEQIGKPDVGQGRNNVIGAWINAQQRQKRIEFTGRLSKSDRVEGHGNLQKLWRVKDEREGRVGGGADGIGPQPHGGVSSSLASTPGSTDPTQRVEASTMSEARGGWDEPRHLEADAATASLPPLRAGADASADDVRAETRPLEGGTEGVPGSALNADLAVTEEEEWELLRSPGLFADAPPGGLPEMGEQLGLLGANPHAARGAYSREAA